MNDAKQKFVIANPMIGALTHEREVTSPKPSRNSRMKWLRAARACAGSRSCTRKNALARKLTESIAKTQPVPATAIRTPETAGPNTFIAFREIPSSAFADLRRSASIVCGTRPSLAGPKNADAAPKTVAVTKKSGRVI